jgi:hypothetical protein
MVCLLTEVIQWLKRIGLRLWKVMGMLWTHVGSMVAFLVVVLAVTLLAEKCML